MNDHSCCLCLLVSGGSQGWGWGVATWRQAMLGWCSVQVAWGSQTGLACTASVRQRPVHLRAAAAAAAAVHSKVSSALESFVTRRTSHRERALQSENCLWRALLTF
jgi:hypothetical protein